MHLTIVLKSLCAQKLFDRPVQSLQGLISVQSCIGPGWMTWSFSCPRRQIWNLLSNGMCCRYFYK